MRRSLCVLTAAAVFSAAPYAASADQCQATTATGTFAEIAFPGAQFTYVSGINNRGEIIGTYMTGGVTTGFVLDRGVYTSLTVPDSRTTRLSDINSSGVIVGSYDDSTGSHGFIWDDGAITTLDVPGAIATTAYGINDAGTVVGLFLAPGGVDGIEHGFVYRDGEFQTVDYPNSGGTTVLDINNAGTALGGHANATPAYFLYSSQGAFTQVQVCAANGVLMELTNQGDLIGSTPSGTDSSVGVVQNDRGLLLVSPPDAIWSVLVAGNAAGVLVGEYADAGNDHHSFVFLPH